MAYDETLCQRVRDLLDARTAFVETKLMGGLVFMVNGNMCCGVTGSSLLVRVGEAARDSALAKTHTRRMEIRRPQSQGLHPRRCERLRHRQGAAGMGAAQPRLCCDASTERKAHGDNKESGNEAKGMKAAAQPSACCVMRTCASVM
ncbi:TfoX/Sxy family protein [Roseiarcaceae bacterium H3SJ34-1]|uniref:TfoX/Sxy family protein n=1 Tax=Terripilifer ovatus TaxID=3032367 RepID=UPI003AB98F39|nr:TfoX/Sxy family protein [Roseiarcaceae bacterium H3SJ34-1]